MTPKLSKRISAIISLVPDKALVCDVGTDHGYLGIHLIRAGIAQRVIATDIAQKPLNNARKNIERAKVENIELRLCDGLQAVSPDETNTVIIAGMGGEVISGILERNFNVTKQSSIKLILQPTTAHEHLRKFLICNGYEILKEIPVFENNKHYSVMLVSYTKKTQTVPHYYYFIGSLSPDTADGYSYINWQLSRCIESMNGLKNKPDRYDSFLYYKSIYDGINNYLKSFGE